MYLYHFRNKTEQHTLEAMRNILNERFRVTHEIPGVFFNSKARMEDVNERTAVESQMTALWNFMSTAKNFEFKDMEDILNDFDTCQTKTAGDIEELKERTKVLIGELYSLLGQNYLERSLQTRHVIEY